MPAASDADYRRFYHLDLADMLPPQLWAEHQRASAALAEVLTGDDPIIVHGQGMTLRASAWLSERVARARAAA